jgi:hypothetical protein
MRMSHFRVPLPSDASALLDFYGMYQYGFSCPGLLIFAGKSSLEWG